MYRVLIVEDDPMVAMINEQYVRKHKQFQVVGSCRDGKAALEFLVNNEADLMILDVFMPQMDGFETLRQIRKRQIPVDVIMVTAANERESLEKALHLGIVDYLIKPFTFERFRMALDKYIAHIDALNDLDTLNQKSIDFIIDSGRRKSTDIHPKGIQEATLQCIITHLRSNAEIWCTGDEIAGQVGLTSVTVRRYMAYLTDAGIVTGQMNYSTGGRPCMLYKIN
jgi:response regulator of citrate/malate metabolism